MASPEGKTRERPLEKHRSPVYGDDDEISSPQPQADEFTTGVAAYRTASHVSGPDAFDPPASGPYREAGDEIYDLLSPRRKNVIVAVLSFCAFLSPQSSTSILAATPEVAETYHTTGSIVNISASVYMFFMGVAPVFWGPMAQVFGRRPVSVFFVLFLFPFAPRNGLAITKGRGGEDVQETT